MDVGGEHESVKFPWRWPRSYMKRNKNEIFHRNTMFPLKFSCSGVVEPPTSAYLKDVLHNLKISGNIRGKSKECNEIFIAAEYKRFPIKRHDPKNLFFFPIFNENESLFAQKPARIETSDKPDIMLKKICFLKATVTHKTQNPTKFPFIATKNQDLLKFPTGLTNHSMLHIINSDAAANTKSRLITSAMQSKQSRIENISHEYNQFPVCKSEQKSKAYFPFSMPQYISNILSTLPIELQGIDAVFGKKVICMNSLKNLNEEKTTVLRKLQLDMSSTNIINKLQESEEVLEKQTINMNSSSVFKEGKGAEGVQKPETGEVFEEDVLETQKIDMNSSCFQNKFEEAKEVCEKQTINMNSSKEAEEFLQAEQLSSAAIKKSIDDKENNNHRNHAKFPLARVIQYGNLTRFPVSCSDSWQLKAYGYQDIVEILKIRLNDPKPLINNICSRNEIMSKEYKQFPILIIQSRFNKNSAIFPIRYMDINKGNTSFIVQSVFKENRKFSIDHEAINGDISATMTQSCSLNSYSKSVHDHAAAVAATVIQDHHSAQQNQTEKNTTSNQQQQIQFSNNRCVEKQHMYNDAVSASASITLPTTAILIAKNINNISEEQQTNTVCIIKNDESNKLADFSLHSAILNIYDEEHQQQQVSVLEKARRITPPMSEEFIAQKQNISKIMLKNSTTLATTATDSSKSTTPNNNSNNITTTNLENLNPNSHQQHSQLHSHSPKRSDVHDTSSHEELVQLVAVSAESGKRLPSSLRPLSSLRSSPSFALTTHENRLNCNNNSHLVQVEENSEYNLNKLEIDEELSDVRIAETVNDSAETTKRLSEKSRQINEMTVTKVGDTDGADSEKLNLSDNSLNDNQQSIIYDPIDEMKFEMKSVKGTTAGRTPAISIANSTTPSSLRMKNELNAINSPNINRSSSAANIKNISYSVDLPSTKFSVNVGSRGASTLPRLGNEVSRSSSIDVISVADSILPARTLLRRQRRLQESTQQQQQNPQDKPEDPIERLNRLRARISGALSEVKGVLTKYSTEGESEGESEQLTAMGLGQSNQSVAAIKKVKAPQMERDLQPKKYDDAAPVLFRFVRKVRRRSVFDEEEEDRESKNQVKEKAIVSANKADTSTEGDWCKEEENIQSKEVQNLESKVKFQETKVENNIDPKEVNKHNKEGNFKEGNFKTVLQQADKKNNEYDWKEDKNLDSKLVMNKDDKPQVVIKKTREECEKTSENKVESQRPALKVLQKPSIENKKKFESEIVAILSRKSPSPEEKYSQTPQKSDSATEGSVAEKIENKVQSCTEEIVTETESKDDTKFEENTVSKQLKETEGSSEKTSTTTDVKFRKKLTVVKTKDYEVRRASIAAVEQSKIEPPIEKEIPQEVKARRRPSDSEAVIKKKVIAARNIIKNNEIAKINLKSPAINITQTQNDVTLPLDTVNEGKSSNESANESKNNTNETNKTPTAAVPTHSAHSITKTKRRLTAIKTKNIDEVRRASIAAEEESHIEPPIEETKLEIKTQMLPSDSEAMVKRKKVIAASKAAVSGDGETTTATSSPKVKLITTKVRRTSLKQEARKGNELMKVNDKLSTAIDQSLITDNTNEISNNKDAVTAKTLPTRFAIDECADDDDHNDDDDDAIAYNDASINALNAFTKAAAATVVATETISKNEATKDFRSATKLDDQSAAMVATLVSPLRASEPSSHQQTVNAAISKTTLTRAELAELVGETIIVVPTNISNNNNNKNNTANNSIKSEESAKFSEIKKESEVKLVQESVRNQNEKTLTQSDTNPEIPDTSKALNADIKELINQKVIPTKNSVNQKQEHQHKINKNQQVSTTIDIATGSDTSKTDNANNAESLSSLSAVNETHSATATSTTIAARSINDEQATETTKASNTSTASISVEKITTANAAAAKVNESAVTAKMPELQVVPTPVKTVQVFNDKEHAAGTPFSDFHAQKKLVFKKLIRKNSIDKTVVAAKKKLAANSANNASFDRERENVASVKIATDEIATDATQTVTATAAIDESDTAINTADAETETPIEPLAPPKKPRKVKKKVVIKRQQRRLSISDTFFREPEEPDDAKTKVPEIETLEIPIEYVTDDEADAEGPEPVKVLKACLKHREYQVGDWVMYGERYRKTQVRWKKGLIIDRITSISYKIDIDGQEISAHISYIKKFTDRKVNFGGKEYLEIDYEQIVEEEKKARSYSIWNMV